MKIVAKDPKTGLVVRDATANERDAYLAQPCRHPSFRKMIRVGEMLVDEDTGPGMWFGGAGF